MFLSKHYFIVGYSFTGDSNGYDYSNTAANNGYLGSKDSYQGFYGAGDTTQKLSNHISTHSLINDNQANIASDTRSGYNGYSASDHGSEYAGYSNTYENVDGDSYLLSTHSTPSPFRGYSSARNNNRDRAFNAYSSSAVHHTDTDFGRYGNNENTHKRMRTYSGYPKTTVIENYPEDSDSDAQGYHDSSDSSSYSAVNDQVYPAYSSRGPTSEYSFVKQKGTAPYSLKGQNKYGDVYPASETRYTRGNVAHVSQNRDVSPYLSDSRPSGQFYKTHGASSAYTSGKPSTKYNYKYSSRYAPNSGMSYLSRERDAYYSPYGKGSGKIVMIKDNRPSYAGHAYSEPTYDNGGHRSKSNGFPGSYSTTSNFDGYGANNSNYDEGPTVPRRYRYAGGPMILHRTVYS